MKHRRLLQWLGVTLISTALLLAQVQNSRSYPPSVSLLHTGNTRSAWLAGPKQPAQDPESAPRTQADRSQEAVLVAAPSPTQTVLQAEELEEGAPPAQAGRRYSARSRELPLSVSFQDFQSQVRGESPEVVTGVYVEGVLALPVVQQPEGDPEYVSPKSGVATQFSSPSQFGVIGLLAHNYLAGSLFYQLSPGQELRILYGDGSFQRFLIQGSHAYQKLEISSSTSDFLDLHSNKVVGANRVFERFYTGPLHVTLQTCLERSGLPSLGLTFTIATPLP